MSISKITGAAPWFGESMDPILQDIRDILSSGELVKGKHTAKFEDRIANMAGTKYSAVVNSGGTALELALLALDIKGKEVIVPTQTFIASANAVTRAGGYPVFADIDKDTLCLNLEDVVRKIGPNTAGIMSVHMFGLIPPSIIHLKNLCKERGLFLIEDAAHAHGASFRGELAGGIGDVGCFSFFATKVVTTGEGGGVTTNRKDIYEKIISFRDHGRSPDTTLFTLPGNNFRLSEIQSAIGWHQMDLLKVILTHRNIIAAIYREGFKENQFFISLPDYEESYHAYWRYPAYLTESINRLLFQQAMWERHGIRITWMYEPLCHQQPVSTASNSFKYFELPVAEWTIKHLINLPTHMGVSEEDAKRVVSSVKEEIQRLKQ